LHYKWGYITVQVGIGQKGAQVRAFFKVPKASAVVAVQAYSAK